jgi:nucleoporin NDC1
MDKTDSSLVGKPTTSHLFQSIQESFLGFEPYGTIACYQMSAFLFAEVCVWSYSGDHKLGIINPGSYNQHPSLNERAIFFRSLFPVLASIQVAQHMYCNLNLLNLPYNKLSQTESKKIGQIISSKAVIRMTIHAAAKSAIATGAGTVLYMALYRNLLWNFWYRVLSNMYRFRPNYGPKGEGTETWLRADMQFLFAGFLLSFLWEFSNLAYSEYIIEQPLKKGHPLTNDSKDPNGSLLSGLRAKRQFAKVRIRHNIRPKQN